MDSSPLISVVMSVYNGERFLREAVESILGQSFRDFEFIVIDDGSTDGSAEILDGYRRNDSRLQVYHQENQGLIESLNRGCRIARGKYIARMDADDIAVSDRMKWQVDFMEKHPEVAALGGAVEFIDAFGKVLGFAHYPAGDVEIKAALLHQCPIQHPSVLMRKDSVSAVGGYRKVMRDAEDYDLWMRMGDTMQLANLDQVVIRYRIHADQISLRKRRQQTHSFLAAQAASVARRNGRPDPLNSVEEITPSALAELGVSEVTRQNALARDYLGWIRTMSGVGEYTVALNTATEMLNSSDWRQAERWAIADVLLEMAKLYWKQKRFWRSIVSVGHAVVTRPMVIGRPLKLLLRPITSPF